MARTLKNHMKIRKDSDTWLILGIGVSKGDMTLCHLASTTRFKKQRNGNNPVQQQDWVKGLPVNPDYISEDV